MVVRYIVISQFILYLLLAFNVVSMNNRFVASLWNVLNAVLEPLLAPIRRRMPPINGMDFSYMVLIFGLWIANEILIGSYAALNQWLLN